MKQRSGVIVLLALVVVLVGINLARRTPAAPAPAAAAAPAAGRGETRLSPSEIPDALLAVAERKPSAQVQAAAVRRNIFEYARVAAPPQQEPVAEAPPPPPPPPPAPVRFYGFAESSRGGKRQVFLTDGEGVYLAAEGDVILQRYRLLRVGKDSIELEEVSGRQHWVVPLEQP